MPKARDFNVGLMHIKVLQHQQELISFVRLIHGSKGIRTFDLYLANYGSYSRWNFGRKHSLVLKKSVCLVSSRGDELIDGVLTLSSFCLLSYSLWEGWVLASQFSLILVLLWGVCSVLLLALVDWSEGRTEGLFALQDVILICFWQMEESILFSCFLLWAMIELIQMLCMP